MTRREIAERFPFRTASACVAVVLLSVTLAGCGYRAAGAPPRADSKASPDARSVAVIALRNDSPEPWLDRVVTDALRREIALRSALSLESDPTRADYVLRGRVLPLEARSNSFSSFVVALEFKVTLALELEVLRREGDAVRLPRRALVEDDVYLSSPDVEVTRTNRLEALRHLSDLLAGRVADRIEWMSQPPRAERAVDGAGG